ncbi:MAG: hypothetical protein Q8R29_00665, partial [bacterium]|nr:hypothetical protein [bacterium]
HQFSESIPVPDSRREERSVSLDTRATSNAEDGRELIHPKGRENLANFVVSPRQGTYQYDFLVVPRTWLKFSLLNFDASLNPDLSI